MIRRPPRSTLDRSSAASDVYKRQVLRVGWSDPEKGSPVVIHFGGWISVQVRERNRSNRAPEYIFVLGVPASNRSIGHDYIQQREHSGLTNECELTVVVDDEAGDPVPVRRG